MHCTLPAVHVAWETQMVSNVSNVIGGKKEQLMGSTASSSGLLVAEWYTKIVHLEKKDDWVVPCLVECAFQRG